MFIIVDKNSPVPPDNDIFEQNYATIAIVSEKKEIKSCIESYLSSLEDEEIPEEEINACQISVWEMLSPNKVEFERKMEIHLTEL